MCDPGDEKYPPSWDDTGGEVTRLEYLRYSEGFLRGLSSLDRDRGVVRLWRALRGVAQTRLRDVDFEKPCAAKGETELAGGRIAFQDELKKLSPSRRCGSSHASTEASSRTCSGRMTWKHSFETWSGPRRS